MKEVAKISPASINSYISANREKLDESLVSLRLMKSVDDFLNEKKITQRDFANSLGYTESFISQMMSGVKKANVAFVNRFEKKYGVEIEFKIVRGNIGGHNKNEKVFISDSSARAISINTEIIELEEINGVYVFENNNEMFCQLNAQLA